MTGATRPPIDGEADRAWQRVRELDLRVARLERMEDDHGLPEEGQRRLDRARARRARATERALLADQLSDELASLRASKTRVLKDA